MNEFDNNMGNTEGMPNDKFENEAVKEISENSENTAPVYESEASEPATYSSIYTPSQSGYTENKETVSYTPNFAVNEAKEQENTGYASYYQNGAMYGVTREKKKNGSARGIVLAFSAVAVMIAVCIGAAFTGYKIGKGNSVNDDQRDKNNVYFRDSEKNEANAQADTERGTDSSPSSGADSTSPKDTSSDTPASITKNPGTSADVNIPMGEVGTLMTKSQVAALVKDSVVEITTEQVVNGNSFWQYVQSGAGSGVIISDDGLVVTNNHVISGASKITVRLTNGNEYEATLIGTDASTDIAVLRIKPNEKLTVATLGSSSTLSIAEEIIVIGNPLGRLGGTVTNGIVSALAREITIDGENMTLIQTNAAVNPGNSGGGMFNLYGELVGVVNAKSTGEDVEGLGFAIPIDTAYDIVLQLMDYGYVRGRVDHGLDLIDINDLFTAASYKVSSLGVYVYESKFTEEIKNGDRIASINGTEVSSSAGVKEALYGCKVGDTVDVTVVRRGKYVDVKLTLREYIPEEANQVSFE